MLSGRPIEYRRFVAQAVVDGNLSTNCCKYALRGLATTATWMRGLEIANGRINAGVRANYKRKCDQQSSGACLSSAFDASLLVDDKGRVSIRGMGNPGTFGDPAAPIVLAGIETAVTGSDMLVYGGVPNPTLESECADGCDGNFFGPHSRTAVGLLPGGSMAVVTADATGQTSDGDYTGLELFDLASFMQSALMVDAAINLDGGGSTVMAVQTNAPGGKVVNIPENSGTNGVCDRHTADGGCERYVGSALIIGAMQGPGTVRSK